MNKKQISIGAILSYIGIFVSIVIGLFYTPLIVKSIGQSQYGIYTLANSLISLFLIDFGLSSATARYVSNYHAENNQNKVNDVLGVIYKLYIIIDIVIFIVFLLLFFFIDRIYVNLSSQELQHFKVVYIIVACYSVINFPFLTLNGILTAYERFIELKIADLLYRIFTVIFVLIALYFNLGLYGLVIVNVFVGILIILFKVYVLKKNTNIRVNLTYKNKGLVNEIFSFSIWITISSLAQRLIFSITPSILGIVSNSSQIAIFGIISTIEGYVFTITTAINGMFMPTLSRAYVKDESKFIQQITPLFENVGRFNFAVAALLVGGFITVGKEFIILWMGSEYVSVYFGVIVVLIPGLLYNPLQVANTAMIVKNKVKYQAVITIIMGLINVIISFKLSSTYGAVGAAIAIFVAYTIRNILYLVFHQKVMKFNLKKFTKRCYIKMLPCLLIPLLVGYFINQCLIADSWLYLLLKVIIVIIVYLFSVILCLNKEEGKKIIGIIKGR